MVETNWSKISLDARTFEAYDAVLIILSRQHCGTGSQPIDEASSAKFNMLVGCSISHFGNADRGGVKGSLRHQIGFQLAAIRFIANMRRASMNFDLL